MTTNELFAGQFAVGRVSFPPPSAGEDVQKGKVPKKVGGQRGQVWSGCEFPVPPSVCGNVLKGHPSCRATMRTASTGFGVATSVLACCLLPLVACTRVLCVCFICRPSRRWRSVGQPDKQVVGSEAELPVRQDAAGLHFLTEF